MTLDPRWFGEGTTIGDLFDRGWSRSAICYEIVMARVAADLLGWETP